jgi:glycosyltransferase involved in cell wall biosynthesis
MGTTQPSLGELELFIDRVPWSEAAQHEGLAEFDLGLAPVPDEPYTRGKCGYKLLQYAASGTPAVASPVGVNRTILAELGMPAPDADNEWADAILDLLGRASATREAAGRKAREVAEQQYSFDVWLTRWRAAVGLPDQARSAGA